jgi:hypothetical protein
MIGLAVARSSVLEAEAGAATAAEADPGVAADEEPRWRYLVALALGAGGLDSRRTCCSFKEIEYACCLRG